MEIPSAGRAIIDEDFNGIKITIPAKKNGFLVPFLGLWLCGWLAGETFAIMQVTGVLKGNGFGNFMLIWLCGWTVAGFITIRTFWWNLKGKEVISIAQGALTIDKQGALFYKAKTYNLREATNFRAQQEVMQAGAYGNRRGNVLNLDGSGTIKFDYGMQTVKFADGIDEAEANFILQKLRNKKIIS